MEEMENKLTELKTLLYKVMVQPQVGHKCLAEWTGLKSNYHDYLITEPVDYKKELERVPDADYELCCALLTMIVWKKDGGRAALNRCVYNSEVIRILNRMIKLQQRNGDVHQ